MVAPEYIKEFQSRWNEAMAGNMGGKIKRVFALDGKTQCGNVTSRQKANHIVSAVDNRGFCFGQAVVDEKSNGTTATPEFLTRWNI